MKLIPVLLTGMLLIATPAMAKEYPFTLADPDAKADAAVKELFDAGQLKSAPGTETSMVAIWLKASDSEQDYLFVAPHGVCETSACWIMGFRQTSHGWQKIYDQPVGEDIDIGITPHVVDGHHDIIQIEEKADKRIEQSSVWKGSGYGAPTSREMPAEDESATEDKN